MFPVCFDATTEDTEAWGPDGSFMWHSSAELNGAAFAGKIAAYPGSGYVVEFPAFDLENGSSADAAADLVQSLQDNSWIDCKTRAVFIEMNLYNPNANHFCVATLLVEFPTVGGVLTSSDFSVHKVRGMMLY